MAITWAGAAWAATTSYTLGARVINGGNVYVCVSPGTSAGAGGPTGTSAGVAIVDGSVTWNFVGTASVWTVVGVAPELATSPALTQAAALASTDKLDADNFAEQLDEAAAYLAAHIATLARMRGHGAVATEREGPFSRGYAMPKSPDNDLGLTAYGARFDEIVRLTNAVFGVVSSSS